MLDIDDLEALCRIEPKELLRRGAGRETFRWREPAGEGCIVKRFARSRSAELLGRRPARQEFESLGRLREAGLRVPEPLQLFESSSVAVLLMEDVPHRLDLRAQLSGAPESAARWLPEVLSLTLGLHARGWYHRDLYLNHFVLELDSEGDVRGLALLDLGRARHEQRARRRWFVKDLAALLHSTPAGVALNTRLRFLALYLNERGIESRRQRRWWLAAVLRKARRMAAHTPRGGTSFHEGVEVVS